MLPDQPALRTGIAKFDEARVAGLTCEGRQPNPARMRRQSICLAMLLLLAWEAAAGAALRGDPRAVALAQRLVEAIGGTALWGRARHLYIEERAFSARSPDGARTIFYRDLRRPRLYVATGEPLAPSYVVGAGRGWRIDGATATALTGEQLARYAANWPANIYVMYHRLAAGDDRLTLALDGENGFSVSEDGRQIGRFTLDARGHLVRWTAPNGEDWIYGPPRAFGPVGFPAWGTRTDGSYRFDYLRVEPSQEELPEETFRPVAPPPR